MTKITYPFELVTDRLVIRSPAETDARQLLEAIKETFDTLRPWMPWANKVTTLSEAEDNCRRREKAFRDGSDNGVHLFLKGPMTFIGGSGLHRIDWSVPKAEIGYWIRNSFSGQGYITEAVREITRYSMEELQMNRVEIRMSSKNVRSRRVPELLDFAFEGILRNDDRHLDGSLRDTCVFAKIREVNHG